MAGSLAGASAVGQPSSHRHRCCLLLRFPDAVAGLAAVVVVAVVVLALRILGHADMVRHAWVVIIIVVFCWWHVILRQYAYHMVC